jgi:hypothetical protein
MGDYITRCEGLECPFRDGCKRYRMYQEDRENKKYAISIIPHFTDKVCLDRIAE